MYGEPVRITLRRSSMPVAGLHSFSKSVSCVNNNSLHRRTCVNCSSFCLIGTEPVSGHWTRLLAFLPSRSNISKRNRPTSVSAGPRIGFGKTDVSQRIHVGGNETAGGLPKRAPCRLVVPRFCPQELPFCRFWISGKRPRFVSGGRFHHFVQPAVQSLSAGTAPL